MSSRIHIAYTATQNGISNKAVQIDWDLHSFHVLVRISAVPVAELIINEAS